MKLTPNQEAALNEIRREYTAMNQFSVVLNPATGSYFSKATLKALADKGAIDFVRSENYSYTVRGSFGRGIRYQRQSIEAVYQIKSPC